MTETSVSSEWVPFECLIVPDRDWVRVIPRGELDLATVGVVARRIEEFRAAGVSKFVFDLRQLTFMDSSGLHLIVCEDEVARSDGGCVELIPGSRAIQRVFDLCGVTERLSFRDHDARVQTDGYQNGVASRATDHWDGRGSPHLGSG